MRVIVFHEYVGNYPQFTNIQGGPEVFGPVRIIENYDNINGQFIKNEIILINNLRAIYVLGNEIFAELNSPIEVVFI